jgi:hypothetical protein
MGVTLIKGYTLTPNPSTYNCECFSHNVFYMERGKKEDKDWWREDYQDVDNEVANTVVLLYEVSYYLVIWFKRKRRRKI